MRSLLAVSAALTLALLVTPVQAHFVWIEAAPVDGDYALRAGFGEHASWESEYAPKIDKTKYWLQTENGKTAPLSLAWNDESECYVGKVDAHGSAAVYGEVTWGLFGQGGPAESLIRYYPKTMLGDPSQWKKLKASDSIGVEIIPVLDGSTLTIEVRSDGKPLPGAKVKVYNPGAKKFETVQVDDQGKGVWNLAGPGDYAATVVDRRPINGEFDGEKYEGEMHCASLTFNLREAAAAGN